VCSWEGFERSNLWRWRLLLLLLSSSS
jgi:hypothetical protein